MLLCTGQKLRAGLGARRRHQKLLRPDQPPHGFSRTFRWTQRILRQWLEAGYWEKDRLFPTSEGTPQGGIISPLLANLTLDGMEQAIRSRIKPRHDQVNFIRYADDFIVTARTKETLEQIVKPAVVAFLAERGLELSEQKTTITHIEAGFNFLGQNVRKYRNKLVIKPAKDGLKALVQKTRECIKGALGQTANADQQAQPHHSGLGQLSSSCLLSRSLSGPRTGSSTTNCGAGHGEHTRTSPTAGLSASTSAWEDTGSPPGYGPHRRKRRNALSLYRCQDRH